MSGDFAFCFQCFFFLRCWRVLEKLTCSNPYDSDYIWRLLKFEFVLPTYFNNGTLSTSFTRPWGLLLLDRWESVINKRRGRIDISSRGCLASIFSFQCRVLILLYVAHLKLRAEKITLSKSTLKRCVAHWMIQNCVGSQGILHTFVMSSMPGSLYAVVLWLSGLYRRYSWHMWLFLKIADDPLESMWSMYPSVIRYP